MEEFLKQQVKAQEKQYQAIMEVCEKVLEN